MKFDVIVCLFCNCWLFEGKKLVLFWKVLGLLDVGKV